MSIELSDGNGLERQQLINPAVKPGRELFQGVLEPGTLLLAEQFSPIESPIDALAGMSRKGMDVEIDVLIDDQTLTGILAESADKVAPLCAALKY